MVSVATLVGDRLDVIHEAGEVGEISPQSIHLFDGAIPQLRLYMHIFTCLLVVILLNVSTLCNAGEADRTF